MEDTITRAEHDEFVRRMDAENERQNHRIATLEESVQKATAIATNVERLAISMEHMAAEQEKQGRRLETLEKRDGEMWRKVVWCVITAVVGIVIAFIFSRIGM